MRTIIFDPLGQVVRELKGIGTNQRNANGKDQTFNSERCKVVTPTLILLELLRAANPNDLTHEYSENGV